MTTTNGASLLQPVKNEQAAAKIGIFGSQGSGKSTTAAFLAAGISKTYHSDSPVAMMDTENGSDFLAPIFKAEGIELLVAKSGAFADMAKVLAQARQQGCCVFIMDSVTHTWRELIEAYCREKKVSRPEFHHWKDIKASWGQWTAAFVNSPLHCIILGRAGYEYEYQENEETGKKELIKGDTKMKAEGEFGYEPSLLVEMVAERTGTEGHHGGSYNHVAYVLKDRARVLNGRSFEFPDMNDYKPGGWKKVFETFRPHLEFYNIGGTQRALDPTTSAGMFDPNGNTEYYVIRQRRAVALEEIESSLTLLWPGQDAKSKRIKILVLDQLFHTRSWSAVQAMHPDKLEVALVKLQTFERRYSGQEFEDEHDILKALGQVQDELKNLKANIPRPPKAAIPADAG